MPFVSRNYDVYVVLCAPHRPIPWSWGHWSRAATLFDPFAVSPRGKTAIRSTQLLDQSRETIHFGKLGWDERSHQRWTHGSPLNAKESAHWKFLSMEAWAPSWSLCEQEPPDFFLSVTRGLQIGMSDHAPMVGVIVAALNGTETPEKRTAFRSAVAAAAREFSSPLTVWKQRRWARPVGRLAFRDAISDLGLAGLFKRGLDSRTPLTDSIFSERWTKLQLDATDTRPRWPSTISNRP